MMSSPYKLLGISPRTPYDDAKRIYRRKMKELHPDRGGDPVLMNQVKEAWDLLNQNKDTMLGQSIVRITHKSLFDIVEL